MKAAENFMKQQVVEIEGKIANKGPRPLESIDVYCFFAGRSGTPNLSRARSHCEIQGCASEAE